MWGLIAGQSLRRQTWDGIEHVLYNDLSGDTHLLGADAIEVLLTLCQGGASEQALGQLLNATRDPGNEAAPNEVTALLHQLAALSLVERRTC